MAAGAHPDVFSLWPEGAAQMHKIDAVRSVAEAAQATTHQGAGRVIRIFQAERMNISAANGLLKVLEEPPAGTQFVLTTEMPGRLPATIVSRCRRVVLPVMTDTEAFVDQLGAASPTMDLLALSRAPEDLEYFAQEPEEVQRRIRWRRQLSKVLTQEASTESLVALVDKTEPLEWIDEWLMLSMEQSRMAAANGHLGRLTGLVRFQERLNRERFPLLSQIKIDSRYLIRALADLWVRVGRLS